MFLVFKWVVWLGWLFVIKVNGGLICWMIVNCFFFKVRGIKFRILIF